MLCWVSSAIVKRELQNANRANDWKLLRDIAINTVSGDTRLTVSDLNNLPIAYRCSQVIYTIFRVWQSPRDNFRNRFIRRSASGLAILTLFPSFSEVFVWHVPSHFQTIVSTTNLAYTICRCVAHVQRPKRTSLNGQRLADAGHVGQRSVSGTLWRLGEGQDEFTVDFSS